MNCGSRISDCGLAEKAWILILRNNPAGRRFWKSTGWQESENVLYAARELT